MTVSRFCHRNPSSHAGSSGDTLSIRASSESTRRSFQPKLESCVHDIVDRFLQHEYDSWAPPAIELIPRCMVRSARTTLSRFVRDRERRPLPSTFPWLHANTGRDHASRGCSPGCPRWKTEPQLDESRVLVVIHARVRVLENTSPHRWESRTDPDPSRSVLPRRNERIEKSRSTFHREASPTA
jgi:hypothetical protein